MSARIHAIVEHTDDLDPVCTNHAVVDYVHGRLDRVLAAPGLTGPVVVVKTDALNRSHPSTIVCPLTTQTARFENPLRVAIPKGVSGLTRASDVLVDQIKAIDNRRLQRLLGPLPDPYLRDLRQK